MIGLFTDFGSTDVYVGQVHAAVMAASPGARWVDLLHDAPAYQVEGSAHLLDALLQQSQCNVVMAVVDPGVGSARRPVAIETDGRWLIGPDNGLLSVAAARARKTRYWEIRWQPDRLSATFHGRDLFAPVAAMLDSSLEIPAWLHPVAGLDIQLAAHDLAQVIYIDHYGNAMTGLRGENVSGAWLLEVGDTVLSRAGTYSAVSPGSAFWYVNSIGLVELAVNCGSAASQLGLVVGCPLRWIKDAASV